jgi:hypothetical protein
MFVEAFEKSVGWWWEMEGVEGTEGWPVVRGV